VRSVSPAAPGQVNVVLAGEIDMSSRPALAELGAWLRESRLSAVVDASEVTFLDCAGWSAVCLLAPSGGGPVLRDPSPAVRRLLGLLPVIEHREPLAAALADDVQAAVRRRAVVDQAVGILVARRGLTPEQALSSLSDASQLHERALGDVAHDVVADAGRAPL
jgi:anti-anti-sigma regulatory factor